MLKLFCLLVLSSVCVSASADSISRIRESKSIVIAHREALLPLSYLADDSKPVGYAMDVCAKVVERIKRELKLPQLGVSYLLVNSGSRLPAIIEGRADLECGATASTAERRKVVNFSIPYFFNSTRFMVRQDSVLKNWSDLKAQRVLVVRGSTATVAMRDSNRINFKELSLSEAANTRDALRILEAGQVDVFVADEITLASLKSTSSTPDAWKVMGDSIAIEAQAIMLGKEDLALKAIVDKEIARLMLDGELNKIYDKWFMQALPDGRGKLNLPMSFLLRDSMRVPSDKVLY